MSQLTDRCQVSFQTLQSGAATVRLSGFSLSVIYLAYDNLIDERSPHSWSCDGPQKQCYCCFISIKQCKKPVVTVI